jgi:hypothetical protein
VHLGDIVKPKPKYKVGDKVYHKAYFHFGNGTVIEAEWTTAANGYWRYRADWKDWASSDVWWAESELLPSYPPKEHDLGGEG